MHVVWVNEDADFTGGCEKYIFQSVAALSDKKVKSTLLYRVGSPKHPAFLSRFDQSFPMVTVTKQLKELNPDLIYVHALNDSKILKEILNFPCKKIRFFHDQRALCLREHKYTTLGNKPCSKRMGLNCYSCLGFLKPSNKPWKVGLRSLSGHQKALSLNKRFDHIIVGSGYMAEQLILHNFDAQKITVSPLFSPTSGQQVQELSLLPGSNSQIHRASSIGKQILFVGQLVRGKGLDTLLNAISLSSHKVKLVVCGTGKMESDYRAQASELGIESSVSFLGQQNASQLRQHYQQSTVVVIPSRAPETFCLVGLEALLNGTPVIASNTGGMSEWFKPNLNGLEFTANDHTQLASVLDRYLSDTRLQQRLRHMILKGDYQRFAPESHINLVHSLMNSMTEAA